MPNTRAIRSERGGALPVVLAVLAITALSGAAASYAMADTQPAEPTSQVLAARTESPAPEPTEPGRSAAVGAATEPSLPLAAVAGSAADPTTTTTLVAATTASVHPTGRFVAAGTTGEIRGFAVPRTYTVEVEEGAGVDPDAFADVIDVILADGRGWTAKGYAFLRVPAGGDLTFTLATPSTTDAICEPLETNGRFSCHEGHRIVLNLTRWNEGTPDLPLDLNDYRAAVVNHELGHELGWDHVDCGGPGLRAPVMMQQSKGLDGCVANAWPTLDGTPLEAG